MKTQRRILLVVGAVLLVLAGLVTLAVILLGGVLGSLIVLAAATAAVAAYLGLIRPWHVRWGATEDEAGRAMPGDGILGPGAGFTTRPGTFIMERRMLLGIKARAERTPLPGLATIKNNGHGQGDRASMRHC